MQDRFKFRFWDKETQTMQKMPMVELRHRITLDKIFADDRVIFMQCAGLKDKNGKLIYEGDILDLYVSSKKLYRYEVKYEIGSFMLVSQDEIFDFPNVWNDYVYPLSQLYYEYQNEENCIYECEIIGNIYENPELLEVENDRCRSN